MSVREIEGLPIIDARKSIRVRVTDSDIAKADNKVPANCAMARACVNHLHVKEARVHLGRVYLKAKDGNAWVRYLTPKNLRTEIIAFDRGGSFAPGCKRPNPTDRLGQKRKTGPKKCKGRKQSKGFVRHVVTDVRGGPA